MHVVFNMSFFDKYMKYIEEIVMMEKETKILTRYK
jgi:hypothetical protein